MNACVNFGKSLIPQALVFSGSRVSIYTAPSEFRQRLEVVAVDFARLQDDVSIDFGNISGGRRNPAVVRQLSCCRIDPYKTTVSGIMPCKEHVRILEQVRVGGAGFARDNSE